MPSPLRFAIVAHRRTGSNHLVSLLNSHPRIVCYGEVFRNLYEMSRLMPSLAADFGPVERRVAEPATFLRAVGGQIAPDVDAWGFKLMPFQTPDGLDEILSESVDRAVILRRDNLLAQHSSDLIAAETGQGVAGRDATIKSAKVHFKAGQFEKFEAHVAQSYSAALGALARAGKPVLDVEYMELGDPELPGRLCDFLGIDAAALKSGHRKRNNPAVINRFRNFNTVRRYLMTRGRNDWAIEARPTGLPG